MNIISDFTYNFQTDDVYRKKVLFWVGLFVVVSLLLGVLLFANSRNNQNPEQDSSLTIPSFFTFNDITQQSFDNTTYLSSVFNNDIASISPIAFGTDNIYYVDSNYKLAINNQVLENSPTLFPQEIYITQNDQVIINEMQRTLILNSDKEFESTPKNANWVTPILTPNNIGIRSIPGFIFLEPNNAGYELKQSSDIKLSENLTKIAQINVGADFEQVELRIFNQNPYLMLYQRGTKQGRVEIWSIRGTAIERVRTISNVENISFSENGILLNTFRQVPTELTQYELFYLDFLNDLDGKLTMADFSTQLSIEGIYGTILAERCRVSKRAVYCVVKKNKAEIWRANMPDVLVGYDLDNGEVVIPNQSSNISLNSIHVSKAGKLFVVGQKIPKLYEVRFDNNEFDFSVQ